MKDPLGHGSNAHNAGIENLPAKMGRRHFEQLAQHLREMAAVDPSGHADRVNEMVNRLATSNPNFRREQFIQAAQPGTDYKNKSTREVTKRNASKQLNSFRKANSK